MLEVKVSVMRRIQVGDYCDVILVGGEINMVLLGTAATKDSII